MIKHHVTLPSAGQPATRPATPAFWAGIRVLAQRCIRWVLCRVRSILTAPKHIECQTRSVREAAAELGLSEITIYRLINRGLLRRLPGVGRVRITKKSIDHYLGGTP